MASNVQANSRPGFGARFLYKVIKNQAMKEDPPEIYGWRTFMMACSACFGGMLFGFDIGTIGGVLELKPFQMYVGIQLSRSRAWNAPRVLSVKWTDLDAI
jgi:hypothetical protein